MHVSAVSRSLTVQGIKLEIVKVLSCSRNKEENKTRHIKFFVESLSSEYSLTQKCGIRSGNR